MADRKISDLTALTTPAAGDYLPIVDISEPSNASKNKRITIEELLRGAPDGTAAAPGIAFESDPDSGIYSAGANQVAISTNGQGRLFIDSSGRAGLGTSAPGAPLHVRSTATAGGNIAYFDDSGSGVTGRLQISTTGGTGGSGIRLAAINRQTLELGGALASVLAVDIASSRVGIGTASPSSQLHVVTSGAGSIRFADGTRAAELGSTGTVCYAGSITAGQDFALYSANTERARIDSSGRLLVGTSNSTDNTRLDQKLAVVSTGSNNYGGIAITSYGGSGAGIAPIIDFKRSAGTTDGNYTEVNQNNVLGYIVWQGADGAAWSRAAEISAIADGDWTTSGDTSDSPGALLFSTTADGANSPTERMRITSNAYVRLASGTGGIQFNGDTAAANALDDYEEGTFTLNVYDATTGGNASSTSATMNYTKIGRIVHVHGAGVGNIDTTGMTAGNIVYLSLPFAAHSNDSGGEARLLGSTLPSSGTATGAIIASGGVSRFLLHSYSAAGGVVGVTVGDLTSGVSDVRYISITYQVA